MVLRAGSVDRPVLRSALGTVVRLRSLDTKSLVGNRAICTDELRTKGRSYKAPPLLPEEKEIWIRAQRWETIKELDK